MQGNGNCKTSIFICIFKYVMIAPIPLSLSCDCMQHRIHEFSKRGCIKNETRTICDLGILKPVYTGSEFTQALSASSFKHVRNSCAIAATNCTENRTWFTRAILKLQLRARQKSPVLTGLYVGHERINGTVRVLFISYFLPYKWGEGAKQRCEGGGEEGRPLLPSPSHLFYLRIQNFES